MDSCQLITYLACSRSDKHSLSITPCFPSPIQTKRPHMSTLDKVRKYNKSVPHPSGTLINPCIAFRDRCLVLSHTPSFTPSKSSTTTKEHSNQVIRWSQIKKRGSIYSSIVIFFSPWIPRSQSRVPAWLAPVSSPSSWAVESLLSTHTCVLTRVYSPKCELI